MSPHSREISFPKRVAILTLHWHGGKTWIEISTLLNVNPDTARQICIRAKERASDPSDFDDVVMHLEGVGRRRQWGGEIVIGEDFSSQFGEGPILSPSSIEGMTVMRDMDWR